MPVCRDHTNFITVVLALFFNFSVTFVSGVQTFSHHMRAVFKPFLHSHTIQFALSGKACQLMNNATLLTT